MMRKLPRLYADLDFEGLRPRQDQDQGMGGPRQDQDQTSASVTRHDTLVLKCGRPDNRRFLSSASFLKNIM